jgi:hypothetical protein
MQKITKGIQKLINEAVNNARKADKEAMEYNGWSNYATWRINLELISDLDGESFGKPSDIGQLASAIESYVYDVMDEIDGISSSIVRDYADAFISSVNWYEIARNFSSDNDSLAYDDNGDLINSSNTEEDDE